MTIQEYLRSANVGFLESGHHHHCRPGWIQIQTCPFCGSDKYHLGINLTNLYGSCWSCGGHRIEKILQEFGATWQQAKAFVKDADITPTLYAKKERTKLKEPTDRGPLMDAHKNYLLDRGFDPEELERIWKIEGIGIAVELKWRIYIPITQNGRRVSWTTRSISPTAQQRYISASADQEAVNHKDVVYGLDNCRHSVVIVEGPTDAWAIGPGAGCLFGVNFSAAQVRQLVRVPFRYVCFDSATKAQARAQELTSQLSSFPGQTENMVLDAKDPGSASQKELNALRRCAKL